MSLRDFGLLAISSVLFTAPPQVIQAYVLEQGFGHGFFGTMVAAIPLLTILVSVPMLGVRPSLRELAGVFGGLVCVFLLVEEGLQRGMSWSLLGLTMLIPLSSAISNTFYKWKLPDVPAAPMTAIVLLVAGLVLLAVAGCAADAHLDAPWCAGSSCSNAERDYVFAASGNCGKRHYRRWLTCGWCSNAGRCSRG